MRARLALLARPLIAALLLAALAGCTGAAPPAAGPGGTLRWSLEGVTDITRLDPARMGGNQENLPIYLIFGGLVRINDRLEVVGEGAERWTVSADGTVYTFYLRENLRYGDCSRATAQHFAAAIARTIAPDTGTEFALTFLANVVGARDVAEGRAETIAGVRAVDERMQGLEQGQADLQAQQGRTAEAISTSHLTRPSFLPPSRTAAERGECA